jgi:putative tryptophan/tyrosine transport system substrate-binding protein
VRRFAIFDCRLPIGVTAIFFVALAISTVAAPVIADAQQAAKIPRIGYLSPRSRVDTLPYDSAFLLGMAEFGYVEGKNVVIEWRFADGVYERLPALAADLVRLNVDVIVAPSSSAIRAAQQATTTIPIVFLSTGDPVGSGFVASLARPGGNITGLSNTNLDVSAKLLELLMAMAPKSSRVAVLGNPGSSTHTAILKSVQDAAVSRADVRVLSVEVRTREEIERGFLRMTQNRADCLMVAADAFLNEQSQHIAPLALKHRLPSISQPRVYAKAGGLMSYGPNTADSYRHAATYVDKILKGAKPAELPVEQPTKFELVVNLKTAKALGLKIPESIRIRADEVIR